MAKQCRCTRRPCGVPHYKADSNVEPAHPLHPRQLTFKSVIM